MTTTSPSTNPPGGSGGAASAASSSVITGYDRSTLQPAPPVQAAPGPPSLAGPAPAVSSASTFSPRNYSHGEHVTVSGPPGFNPDGGVFAAGVKTSTGFFPPPIDEQDAKPLTPVEDALDEDDEYDEYAEDRGVRFEGAAQVAPQRPASKPAPPARSALPLPL